MTEKGDIGGLTIIAMKGGSRYRNRKVAFNLAQFLKCPLIDTRDIHQAIQKSSSSQTNDTIITEESAALAAAYGVASTQLSLKFPVIIVNGPHPPPPGATIGNLWRPLAASSGARLVVVECHPPDDDVAEDDDDGISLFHVDAESFDMKKAEGFVSKLLRRQKRNNTTTTATTTTTANSNNKAAAKKEKEKRIKRRNDHLHEWVEKQPNGNTADLSCIACQDSHDDAVQIIRTSYYYQCADCDFALHKHCAEKFDGTLLTVLLRCPPYLRANHPLQGYDFPSKVKCRNCRDDDDVEDEFSAAVDDCHDCLMQTNLRHEFLPTVLRNKDAHQHRLNLVIMPFGYHYKYLCGDCGGIGYSVGYKCYECNERPNYHVPCALMPFHHPYHFTSVLPPSLNS